MSRNIDNSGAVLGTIAIGEALSDPLANTKGALRSNKASHDLTGVFAHMHNFWVTFIAWSLCSWGTYKLMEWSSTQSSGWFMFAAVILMLIFYIGMPLYVLQEYCWFVRGKMLTRVFPVFSTPWKMLSQSHGYSGKTAFYFSSFLMLIYPLTFGPALLIWDALRLIRFAISYVLTGGKVRFGGTGFVWYKKQAKLYNQLKASSGPVEAEHALRLSACGVDIPVLMVNKVTHEQWLNEYRNAVFGPKIQKYGNLFN